MSALKPRLGGPIAFVEDGDEIVADLNKNELNCTALADPAILKQRKAAWDKVVAANGGIHPNCGVADTRLLHRARLTAVPATRGGGLHPNREVWVRQPREATRSGFVPNEQAPAGDEKGLLESSPIGAPRSMKRGTIASPWRCDAGA